MKKTKRISLIMIALAALATTACTDGKEPEQREKVIPVKVIAVAPSAITVRRNYVGTIEESQAISLSFSSMGTVEQTFVVEGQRVAKGQLLARLNTTTAQNAYAVSQAQLAQAQDAYDRLSKVHDNGSLPDIKFVEVEAGLQQAKSMAAIGKKSLDDCNLYAPQSGVIAQCNIEAGTNVMPGVTAFQLVIIDKVTANFSVPENEISSTHNGQKAVIEVAALNNETFEGKIETKGVSANALSHSYEVKIAINNRDSKLLPGMVCKVRLVRDDATTEIVVPNSAIQIAPDGRRFVWLAVEMQSIASLQAKRRFVKTGSLTDDGIAIREGLQTGDRIIVEGCRKVSDGMKIMSGL